MNTNRPIPNKKSFYNICGYNKQGIRIPFSLLISDSGIFCNIIKIIMRLYILLKEDIVADTEEIILI